MKVFSSSGILTILGISASLLAGAAHAQQNDALFKVLDHTTTIRISAGGIVREHAGILLGIQVSKSKQGIAAAEQEMTNRLKELHKIATTPQPRGILNQLEQKVGIFIKHANEPVGKDNLGKLSAEANGIADNASQLLAYFEKNAKTPAAEILVTVTKARLAAGKLTRDYFTNHLKISGGASDADVKKGVEEFEALLTKLEGSPLSGEAIRQDLELAKTQWIFMKNAIGRPASDKQAEENVAKTAVRLLEVLDDLVIQYNKALKQLLG